MLLAVPNKQRQSFNVMSSRTLRWNSRRQPQQDHQPKNSDSASMTTSAVATSLRASSDGGGGNGSSSGITGINMTREIFLRVIQSFVVASPFLVELYSRLGSIFADSQLPSGEDLISRSSTENGVVDWEQIRHITLVFHGAGGQDQYTDELMTNLKTGLKESSSSSSHVQIIEWSKYSTNLFRASFNGEAIGRRAAKYLSPKATNVETVHLIGISVGAFAANAAATEWKQNQQQRQQQQQPYVQLTLLDPFTQRGIFGIGYGQRNFGLSDGIDYTEQYLNRDDPVPSTNEPLQHAVCYDVTPIRPEEIFGHDWPLVYYARRLGKGERKEGSSWTLGNVGIVVPAQRKSPGQVITVNTIDR